MLTIDITKRWGGNFSLHASFTVPSGVTALFGPSGAGKTTILDCIAGLMDPEQGSIRLNGDPLFDSQNNISTPTESRRLGYVFQSLALFPHMTVQENVEFGIRGESDNEKCNIAASMLNSMRIVHLASSRPERISGGERQRVAIARALAPKPRVLLLDEPFTALDYETKSHILNDLSAWVSHRNLPVLFVTHAVEEVFALADRVVTLEAGKIVAMGSPADVLGLQCDRLISDLSANSKFNNKGDVQS